MPDRLPSLFPTWREIQSVLEGMRPEDQGQNATQLYIPCDVFDAGYQSRSFYGGMTPEDTDSDASTLVD